MTASTFLEIKDGDSEKLILMSSTSDNFKSYFSNIPDKKRIFKTTNRKTNFFIFKSLIDLIGPSFNTTRLFNGVLTKDPNLTIGKF